MQEHQNSSIIKVVLKRDKKEKKIQIPDHYAEDFLNNHTEKKTTTPSKQEH